MAVKTNAPFGAPLSEVAPMTTEVSARKFVKKIDLRRLGPWMNCGLPTITTINYHPKPSRGVPGVMSPVEPADPALKP